MFTVSRRFDALAMNSNAIVRQRIRWEIYSRYGGFVPEPGDYSGCEARLGTTTGGSVLPARNQYLSTLDTAGRTADDCVVETP
jgi:hypothetical protein